MTPAQAIVKLAQLGIPTDKLDDALAVLEAMEAGFKAKDESRREKDRIRKREERAASKDVHGQSEDVTATSTDTPSPLVPPLSPAPLSPPIIPPTSQKRATRLPDDFDPDGSCWALAERLNLTSQHCQNELDQFRDYWRSVPGAKGLKLDWQATFRTWLRKSAERKPHGSNRQRDTSLKSGFADIYAALDTAEARLAAEGDGSRREDTLALPGLRKSAA